MPSVEDLKRQLAEAEATQAAEAARSTQYNIPTVKPAEEPDRYSVTSWGETEFDFRTPSGQLCRLKKLDLAELAAAGVLDRVSRLPGIAGALVAQSEGQPPAKEPEKIDADTIKTVVDMTNVIVPMVVVAPKIEPLPEEGEERFKGLIYVDSIEITDRVAIMNRVLGGLAKLDSFRQ
jgi:hypothetical protein